MNEVQRTDEMSQNVKYPELLLSYRRAESQPSEAPTPWVSGTAPPRDYWSHSLNTVANRMKMFKKDAAITPSSPPPAAPAAGKGDEEENAQFSHWTSPVLLGPLVPTMFALFLIFFSQIVLLATPSCSGEKPESPLEETRYVPRANPSLSTPFSYGSSALSCTLLSSAPPPYHPPIRFCCGYPP